MTESAVIGTVSDDKDQMTEELRDKVTGKARFGADVVLPETLIGAVFRSPHAHARLLSIDVDKAMALPGVMAVITSADMPEVFEDEALANNPKSSDFKDLSANALARSKVFYEGHAIAAVAAIDAKTAQQALSLIEVEYAVLPHVVDLQRAMEPDAPLLHDHLFCKGMKPASKKPSNIASRYEQIHGDVDAAFAEAEIVISEEFTTQPVHQACIETQACLVQMTADRKLDIWCSTEAPVIVQEYCARLLDIPVSDIRVKPLEMGGGSGGKTTVYLEPLAALLSLKSGRPVQMQMSRSEVFKATGPASGTYISMKIGAGKDGRLIAAQGILCYQAGAFPGAPIEQACTAAFAPYDIPNVKLIAYDVVVNQPKAAAYRAPGAPMASFAAESLIDMLAQRLDMDPVRLRLLNAVHEGTQTSSDVTLKQSACRATLEAVSNHPHYLAPLAANQGRGVASGFWCDNGAAPVFAAHICDLEVDPETGSVKVLRYTALQNVGGAISPFSGDAHAQNAGHIEAARGIAREQVAKIEGLIQGGAAQGIGWALNEASQYDENGRLLNPGFLDYRIPVASDLPMIDAVILERSGSQPIDEKSVGDITIVPPLGAVANALARASGARLFDLPMSPPAVQKVIKRAARRRR